MSKPYLNLNCQIGHLKNKGIYLGNRAEVKRVLTRLNFQRFLAYRVHFFNSQRKIKSSTKFKHIYKLHEFDKELRDLTGAILEDIELNFRRHIAYTLGNDGVHSYLNVQNFRDSSKHAALLISINRYVSDAQTSIKGRKVVKYHLDNHNDDLPIYKVVEILTFGELSKFFENLKSSTPHSTVLEYKDKITEIYIKHKQNTKITNKFLVSWLRELVEIRNKCAHYDMLWDYQKQLKYLRTDSAWIKGVFSSKHGNTTYKFYGICLIFKELCLSKKDFKKYMYNLKDLSKKYSHIITLTDLGFPPNWEQDLGFK